MIDISPSPYPHGVKCYVGWSARVNSWLILGHRWGDVPYHVGHERDWLTAVTRAQEHVRREGLLWAVSPDRAGS